MQTSAPVSYFIAAEKQSEVSYVWFVCYSAGNLDYDLALGLTDYLSQEQEYVPWISALNGLAYFATQFSTYDMERNTQHYRIYKVSFVVS